MAFFILKPLFLCLSAEAATLKTLPNGLKVIVKEDHRNPLVSISLFVRVGSAREGAYLGSGISHLIEHMLFKGTEKYPPGSIEKLLNKYGGTISGFTTFDYTGYNITILKQHVDTALDIIKEMFTSPEFREDELKKEKEVIKREMDLADDDPLKRLSRITFATAYRFHPYRLPIIGYKSLFSELKREDLVSFFKKNYGPENSVLSIVGDIDAKKAMRIAGKVMGSKPRTFSRLVTLPPEPRQLEKRHIEEPFDTEGCYINIAYHSVSINEPDLYAIDLLSYILGGGESSLLNTKLRLKDQLALSVSSYSYTPLDQGLFVISIVSRKEKASPAIKTALEEIENMKREGISEEDLARAKNNFIAAHIFDKESITAQANNLAIAELLTGDPMFFDNYIKRVKEVSVKDIKSVTNRYLTKGNMTIAAIDREGNILSAGGQIMPHKMRRVRKITLDNGLPVIISEDHSLPLVSVSILFKAGLLYEPEDKRGLSNITALMLMDGTDNMTKEDLARLYESRGININSYSANNSMGITASFLKEHTELAFDILSELCHESSFPLSELAREKKEAHASIDMQDDRVFNLGLRLLKEMLFKQHPYRYQAPGTHAGIDAIKREDVIGFFEKLLYSGNMTLGVSGDVTFEEAKALAEKYFSFVPRAAQARLSMPEEEPAPEQRTKKHLSIEKKQSLVLYGFRGIDVYDKDRYAVEAMVECLSSPSGVFFKNIREKRGLAYSTGAFQVAGLQPGYIVVYALTSRKKIEHVKGIIESSLRSFARRGVSEEELLKAKNHLKSTRLLDMQKNSAFIFKISLDELYGIGYNAYKDYDRMIDKVTPEDIKNAAKRLLQLNNCALLVLEGTE